MELRLIVDAVRRAWTAYLIGGVALFTVVVVGARPRFAMVLSLIFAAGLGPMLVVGRSAVPRETYYLPIASRQIWRASWFLWTFGAVLWLAVVHLGGLVLMPVKPGQTGEIFWGTVTLSTVYDLAYVGAFFSVPFVMRAIPNVVKRREGERDVVVGLLAGASLLALGGALIGVLVVSAYALPTRWTDVDATVGGAVLIGLALTVAGYFYTPARGIPDRGVRAVTSGQGVRWAPRKPHVRRWMDPGFTGLRLLAWREATFALAIALCMVVVMAVSAAVGGRERNSMATAWLVSLCLVGANAFATSGVRCLRVLPLSTWRLAWLLILTPMWRWTLIAALLSGVDVAVYGYIPFREPYVVVVAGTAFAAFSVGWTLICGGAFRRRLIVAAGTVAMILGLIASVAVIDGRAHEWLVWVLPAAMIAIALGLTRVALTRRPIIYQPDNRTAFGTAVAPPGSA